MKKHLALFMIVILAVSVISAAGVVTTQRAEAAIATKLTAFVDPQFPTRGQQFTISGTLTTSDGKPIANKAITVSWKASDGRSGKLASVKTDSQGRYAKADSAKVAPRYLYTVTFAGDTTYARASTSLDIQVGLTVTSIMTTNPKPLRNQEITLKGFVRHSLPLGGNVATALPKADKPITGQVTLYRRVSDGQGGWTAWKEYKKATLTPDNRFVTSYWSTTAYGYTLDTQFKAVYQGSAYYFGSESRPITITGFGVD